MSPRRRKAQSRDDTRWRIWPLPSLSYAVAALAQREGRSVAETVILLVGEALRARVAAAAIEPVPTTSS
jgi:hypothetical protein